METTLTQQDNLVSKRPASDIPKENNEKQYKKKFKKGVDAWQESNPNESKKDNDDVKLKKRKVALLMSYCGTGYQGMQMQTIEDELHKALAASGAVSADNAMDPNKISFMRAARTDKGVHAAGQVVSLKLICEDESIIDKINQHLPPQIRVWGYTRTKNGFHAKNHCDSRIYEYLMPTYVFQQANPLYYPYSTLHQEYTQQETKKEWLPGPTLNQETGEYTMDALPVATAHEMTLQHAYRLDPETLATVRKALEYYVGNHNYHNFTLGKKFKDRSSIRHIKSFTASCSDPFIRDGMEWISLKVHGQSFMIHQIRLVILLVRTKTPLELIPKLFQNVKVNIPKAPSLGLLLERIVYDVYNQNIKDPRKNEPFRDPIDFTPFQVAIQDFKEEWIYSKQIAQEAQEYTQVDEESTYIFRFEQWIRGIDSHCYEYMWYLTADGTIDHSKIPKTLLHLKEASENKDE